MSDSELNERQTEEGQENPDWESVVLGDDSVNNSETSAIFVSSLSDDSRGRDEEEPISEPDSSKKEEYKSLSLDSVPDFKPLQSLFDHHVAQPYIPKLDLRSPLTFFRLFVLISVFETMAANTNAYAELKGATEGKKRKWKPMKENPSKPSF